MRKQQRNNYCSPKQEKKNGFWRVIIWKNLVVAHYITIFANKYAQFYDKVDLILLRKDKTVNLCEMKFCEGAYNIDRKENENLRNRIASFRQNLNRPSYSIRLTMVTSFGLTKGKYNDIVADQVVLDDLFEK